MNPGNEVCPYCIAIYAQMPPTIELRHLPRTNVWHAVFDFPEPPGPGQHYQNVGCPVYVHELFLAVHMRAMLRQYYFYELIVANDGAPRGGFIRQKYGGLSTHPVIVVGILLVRSLTPAKLAHLAQRLRQQRRPTARP